MRVRAEGTGAPIQGVKIVAFTDFERRAGVDGISDDQGEVAALMAPFGGSDQDAFIAQFSNIGPEIDLTARGVGIVSTVPDDRYGVMDGTSMACPAVAGFAPTCSPQTRIY